MKIISWNVNGIRSACRNGFMEWLEKNDADIVCLQEIKAQREDIDLIFKDSKYKVYSKHADKRGYSGVAVLTKQKPISVKERLGVSKFDHEGRMLELEYPDFILFALYIPHGGREKEKLPYKLEVYGEILRSISKVKNKKVILAGDFNIAHEEIDLARPKENRRNIMFTDEERDELDKMNKIGFVDTFRELNKEGGNYTWWPYRNSLREKNVGWRIDYIFASKSLAPSLKKAFILRDDVGSDHCPIGAEFDI